MFASRSRRRSARRRVCLIPAALLLAACSPEPEEPRLFSREPEGIMGTRSALMVILPPELQGKSDAILRGAEEELRRLEAIFSTWIEISELSRFNAAPADERVPLSPEVLEVLTGARRLHAETAGAFDVTARPLMERWRRAGREGARPSAGEIAAARRESTWDLLELHERSATKSAPTVAVDLDGIAKGFAIDRALEVLRASGALGGLVEVGGDLRVFGEGPEDGRWPVGLRSPWQERSLGRLDLRDAAICTSGGYARFMEIEGRRYAEILDPRTGLPIESGGTGEVASVTVVAPDAMTADAWATALTVLGPEGLGLLPPGGGIEALLIVGGPESFRIEATGGLEDVVGHGLGAAGRPDLPTTSRVSTIRARAGLPPSEANRDGGGSRTWT